MAIPTLKDRMLYGIESIDMITKKKFFKYIILYMSDP